MPSDPDAQPSPADWYLIASRGDLVLRLSHDLQIGEDGVGGILLSPAREDALLRVSVRNSELTVQALALDWTFCDARGSTRQHQTFAAGTSVRLNFPTCSLTITPDFLAGERAAIDCVLELRPITPPAVALARLAEPITLVDQPVLTFRSLPPIGVATTEEIAALLEATTDDAEQLLAGDHDVPDETPIDIPVLQEAVTPDAPIRAPAGEPPTPMAATAPRTGNTGGGAEGSPARSGTSRRAAVTRPTGSWRGPLAVACLAALTMLAPMALLLDDPEGLGVRLPPSGFLDTGQSAEPVWPEDPPPLPMPATRPVPTIEPAVTVSDTSVGSVPPAGNPAETEATLPFEEPLPLADQQPADVAPAEPEPSLSVTDASAPAAAVAASDTLSPEQAARVDALLAEAQALFDAGAIVTPVHENAVGVLVRVLTLDPTNEAGLDLMYQSAVRLVEEAQAAHAAGDDYLARNLLEDVLGFHPEFEMARKLQQDWNVNGNG